jgi:hypothetical protein
VSGLDHPCALIERPYVTGNKTMQSYPGLKGRPVRIETREQPAERRESGPSDRAAL